MCYFTAWVENQHAILLISKSCYGQKGNICYISKAKNVLLVELKT